MYGQAPTIFYDSLTGMPANVVSALQMDEGQDQELSFTVLEFATAGQNSSMVRCRVKTIEGPEIYYSGGAQLERAGRQVIHDMLKQNSGDSKLGPTHKLHLIYFPHSLVSYICPHGSLNK